MSGAVVVTGASSGIGAAAVREFASRGFVTFAGVRSDEDAKRCEELAAGVRAVRLDVTDADSIAAAARTVEASGLPLRALVNNAGIAVGGPLEFLPAADLRKQFDVNLFGAVAVTQAFVAQLRAARGRLVFVGSISGRLSVPFIAPYSASKFALRAVSDGFRVELAPWGIRTSLIEPSSVKTPIWQKGRDARADMEQRLPAEAGVLYRKPLDALKRILDAEEDGAIPVGAVTDAILAAATGPRPKARYLVGGAARGGSIVALLPAALRDTIMRGQMRLP